MLPQRRENLLRSDYLVAEFLPQASCRHFRKRRQRGPRHLRLYAELLDRLTDLTLALVEACADVPADAIMMGDDWGDQRGVMIGPERWRRLFKPRYTRIFEAIHEQGKLAIMHCCGSTADIQADIIETGLDVLESVQPEAGGMNPYGLKEALGRPDDLLGMSRQPVHGAVRGSP